MSTGTNSEKAVTISIPRPSLSGIASIFKSVFSAVFGGLWSLITGIVGFGKTDTAEGETELTTKRQKTFVEKLLMLVAIIWVPYLLVTGASLSYEVLQKAYTVVESSPILSEVSDKVESTVSEAGAMASEALSDIPKPEM